jgi:hypothetical protein
MAALTRLDRKALTNVSSCEEAISRWAERQFEVLAQDAGCVVSILSVR